jgi:three-Cys-motif partner protein
VEPPFREYYFIDIDSKKVKTLRQVTAGKSNVHIYEGDCNEILLQEIFPKVGYRQFRRGLCLLDPYGLDLAWVVMETAGRIRTIDMFLNFPVMDINRNALWRNLRGICKTAIARMNRFWGDESWREIAYKSVRGLFEDIDEKVANKYREHGAR